MKISAECTALGAGVLAIVAWIVSLVRFAMWRQQVVRDLRAHGTVVKTPRGPIEYAEVGNGLPVLFVHGTPGGYDTSLAYIKTTHLDTRGYRYIMPSRPGYLRTPLSVGETPREQAQAFAALLTELGIDKVIVWAGSGSGPSGLEFVLQYPHRCSALILVEALTQRPTGAPPRPSVLMDYFVWQFGRFMVSRWQATNPSDRDISAIGYAVINAMVPGNVRLTGQLNDVKQYAQIVNWPLNQIQCPTLILHGTADKNVAIANSEQAHAQIAGSQFVKFPDADHFMVVTKHRQLNDVIGDFLAKHVKS